MTPEEIAILQIMASGQLPEGMAGKVGVQQLGGQFPLPTQPNPQPEGIVLHHTAGSSLEGALNTRDPFGNPATGYNYYIGPDDRVYERQSPDRSTVHMRNPGDSRRRPGVAENLTNQNTISSSIVAPTDEEVGLGQRAVQGMLTRQLMQAFNIRPENVWGHGELQTNRTPAEGRDQSQAFRLGGPPPSGRVPMTPNADPTAMLASLLPPRPGAVAGPQTAAPAPTGPQYPRPAGNAPPQAAPTNPEAQQAGWSGWLQDPVNRAFLLSFGAQALQPAWGGLGAAFGQALGAGAEAASGTAKLIADEERFAQTLNQKTADSEADRKNRLQVAQVGADSRVEVANIRGQYSLQRAQAAGAKTPNELAAYNSVFNSVYRQLAQNNILLPPDQQLTPEQLAQEAGNRADQQYTRFRSRSGQNAPGGDNSSVVPAPPAQPGVSPPPTQPGSAAQNDPATSPSATAPVSPRPFWPSDQPEAHRPAGSKGVIQGPAPVRSNQPAPAAAAGPMSRDSNGKEYPEGTEMPVNGRTYVAKGGKWVPKP